MILFYGDYSIVGLTYVIVVVVVAPPPSPLSVCHFDGLLIGRSNSFKSCVPKIAKHI